MVASKLRTVSIIEGTTGAGKTNQLVNLYRVAAKVENSMLLSFEENLEQRIPAEELEAQLGYHKLVVGTYSTLDDFVLKINQAIAQRGIEHVFIDSIDTATKKLYRPSEIYDIIHRLTSSVTTSIQLPRKSHVDNS